MQDGPEQQPRPVGLDLSNAAVEGVETPAVESPTVIDGVTLTEPQFNSEDRLPFSSGSATPIAQPPNEPSSTGLRARVEAVQSGQFVDVWRGTSGRELSDDTNSGDGVELTYGPLNEAARNVLGGANVGFARYGINAPDLAREHATRAEDEEMTGARVSWSFEP